ncbi:hypothetical protein [Corynebacterium bovis]|uniref:Cytochrome bd-type quinol oxidase subunit 2 n=3 Tax=Corynebacterium bovis TaxID=36808 RepID=A0A8H9YBC0_9CORY|nr:hypothetical protein [Corynebacterium bovis]MBB3115931.1 cytochrome bd-type quinol oxidase subunit 2 [Corynebacterium bovis DSM 20582 = CIP 54.80]MDH2456869.1 hypothetical protein [Corynebacterium bovis]MDN8579438.1 hypothetical protein [Corynebacterium bovis]QQC46889.1 hypothetical protein I6I09_07180 [Corynebacterium bovis]WJY78565.1 hypothetical protein CBOVI_10415 [Corynebacterium bovis DSM 20582 = CIP 54.80]
MPHDPRTADEPLPRRSSDELAADPLLRLDYETARRNSRQAWALAVAVPVLTLLVFAVILVAGRLVGGPDCEPGAAHPAHWLCSDGFVTAYAFIPPAVPLVGLVTAMVTCWRRYARHQRWWPWLAVVWFFIPLFLLVMTTTTPSVIVPRN